MPLPGLEWPDGSRYGGQLEDVVRTGQMEIEQISDEESTSMEDMTFVGRVRIENIEVAPDIEVLTDQQSLAKIGLIGNKLEVAAVKKDEKTSSKFCLQAQPHQLLQPQTRLYSQVLASSRPSSQP